MEEGRPSIVWNVADGLPTPTPIDQFFRKWKRYPIIDFEKSDNRYVILGC